MEPFGQNNAASWLTAAEIVQLNLPGLPGTVQKISELAKREGWRQRVNLAGEPRARRRKGRGGGFEYHVSLLPMRAQVALLDRLTRAAQPAGKKPESSELWDWYARQPDKKKVKAEGRLRALRAIHALEHGGMIRNLAVFEVARKEKVSARTLYNWLDLVAGAPRSDWLPLLCPRHAGRAKTVECDDDAWKLLKAYYLTQSRMPFDTAYMWLQATAEKEGWSIPSARTLRRRLEREVPKAVQVYLRQGPEALARMYPAQERDRSKFHALEAVNIDGHKWDVFVKWPGLDKPVRLIMVAIQDLYSGKILSWRVDLSENADLVRLALKDVFERYGVFDYIWLDNGRGFAAKCISGGTSTRFRFKHKPEEPVGILTALGIEIRWTKPYSGQSKPIERAFGDLCNSIAKHPAFEGAYTGNKPDAKPENYASRAVPLDLFLKVVDEGIRLHNARAGRRTQVCGGVMSFDEAFEKSYASSAIRKASPEQLQMCLMAAEAVRVSRTDSSVRLLGNRYWAEFLHEMMGKPVTVRFDPDALHDGAHIYRQDGSYLGFAECFEAVGFADKDAARRHERKRKTYVRAARDFAKAERDMTLEQIVAALPDYDEPPTPETKVVRAVVGNTARKAEEEPDEEEINFTSALSAGLTLVQGGKEL